MHIRMHTQETVSGAQPAAPGGGGAQGDGSPDAPILRPLHRGARTNMLWSLECVQCSDAVMHGAKRNQTAGTQESASPPGLPAHSGTLSRRSSSSPVIEGYCDIDWKIIVAQRRGRSRQLRRKQRAGGFTSPPRTKVETAASRRFCDSIMILEGVRMLCSALEHGLTPRN